MVKNVIKLKFFIGTDAPKNFFYLMTYLDMKRYMLKKIIKIGPLGEAGRLDKGFRQNSFNTYDDDDDDDDLFDQIPPIQLLLPKLIKCVRASKRVPRCRYGAKTTTLY